MRLRRDAWSQARKNDLRRPTATATLALAQHFLSRPSDHVVISRVFQFAHRAQAAEMSAAAVTVAQRVLDATAGDPLGVQLDAAVLMAEEERAQALLDLAESCNTSSFFTSTLGDVRVLCCETNCSLHSPPWLLHNRTRGAQNGLGGASGESSVDWR